MKKTNNFNVFLLSTGLLVLASSPSMSHAKPHEAPQVFRAQEDDGTAQVIQANTRVDAASEEQEATVEAEVATAAAADAANELKRPNNELKKPLADQSQAVRPTENPLDARFNEKSRVTAQAKAELAQKLSAEAAKKELLSRAKKYDAVPDERISELAQRLKFTNEILKRFGRAYDYRLMTLGEFKKVLAELELKQEKSKE